MEASAEDWARDGIANRNSAKLTKSSRFIDIESFRRSTRIEKLSPKGTVWAGWEAVPRLIHFDATWKRLAGERGEFSRGAIAVGRPPRQSQPATAAGEQAVFASSVFIRSRIM